MPALYASSGGWYEDNHYYVNQWATTTSASTSNVITYNVASSTPAPKPKPKTNLDWLADEVEAVCALTRAA